jgi:hypothetical protein
MNGDWFKLIVGGAFLLVWALTQLFNKEVNPTPNRTQGFGPRPGGLPPAPRPLERGSGLDSGGAFSSGSSTRRGSDDVLIIRAEQTRPPRLGPTNPSTRRQPAKGKQAAAPPKLPDAGPKRALSTSVSQNVAQQLDTTLDVRPLTETAANPVTSAQPTTPATPGGALNPTLASVRQMLTSPSMVREAFVLNEILQPPIAARRVRRG